MREDKHEGRSSIATVRNMKTIILGLGNPILTDDAVGFRMVQELKEEIPDLEVSEVSEAGIALLDYVIGYDKLIIIDSIKTGKGKPGELYKLELEDLKPTMDFSSSHGVDIATAFKVGEGLGYRMPKHVSIYAVEVRDNTTFGERCTEEVEERIPFIVRQIIEEEKL
ncbi:MAG: hydrogenase maturation protease [Dehalococcoidia bacterium]|nr:hydrogenase maturation protease [Dehalococcoidia bacterium]